MPSIKLGTITKDVNGMMKAMVGASEYREKLGVIRCAVGQLGFTPEEMQANIKAFITKIREDLAQLSDRIGKDIHEVVSALAFREDLNSLEKMAHDIILQVLSSTNAPGFSLNGEFRSPTSLPTKDLAV